jgi:ribose transport system substrate-binding protein
MRAKFLTGAVVGLSTALALSACGSDAGSSSGSGSGDDPQVVMLLNDQFDPYYLTLVDGAEKAAKDLGIDFSWQAPTTLDVNSQTQLLQSVAATKPDGIIMSALDADAMSAPMKQVVDSGIPIVTVDADVNDKDARLATIRSDGEATGAAAADVMNELTGGQGAVGYVGYTPGIQSVDARLTGWKNQLKTFSGLDNVGEQYAGADTSENVAKASALISKEADIKAIFASWTNAVVGTAQAVKQSGKDIAVIGVDAAPDQVDLLKSGDVAALVAQKPAEMGKIAIEELAGYITDGTEPKSETLLDSVVITQDNMDDPEFSKYFYVAAGKKE